MSYLAQLKRLESEKISINTPEAVLTELTKAPSVSFGSAIQAHIKKTNDVKVGAGDTAAIRAWLAHIGETDPAIIADVLHQCQQDADARAYYLQRAADELPKPDTSADARMEKVIDKLHADTGLRYVMEAHIDADPDAVILTLAIRGKGACELRIPKSRYDAFALLELIEKHTKRETLQ